MKAGLHAMVETPLHLPERTALATPASFELSFFRPEFPKTSREVLVRSRSPIRHRLEALLGLDHHHLGL